MWRYHEGRKWQMQRRILIILTACILVLSMCLNPVMAAASEDGSGETEETSAEEVQSADEIAAGRFFDAVRAIVLAKAGEGKSKTKAATAIYEKLTDSQLALVYSATNVPLYGSGYSSSGDTDTSDSSSGDSSNDSSGSTEDTSGGTEDTSGSTEDTETGTGSSSGDGDDAGSTINIMETYNKALTAYEEDRKFRSVDGWYIVLADGNVTYYRAADPSGVRNASVPRQVQESGFVFKVSEISSYAFKDCRRLETVVIHRNIKYIGRYAFKNTPQLRTIKILAKGLRKGSVKNAFTGAGSGRGSYTGSNLVVKVPETLISYYNSLFKKEGALHRKATLRKA